MLKWLKIKEYGFEQNSCISCREDPEEADELVDGVPFCLKEGYCKHLKNVKSIIHKEELEGNPLNFLLGGALEKFEVISEQIYSLSPYDGIKLPTAMFTPHMEGEIDLSASDFMELLSLKTSYIRNSILTERLKQQRKNGS